MHYQLVFEGYQIILIPPDWRPVAVTAQTEWWIRWISDRVVVGVDEVGVVGQPADAEHDQDHDEHLGQLKANKFVKLN